MKCGFVVLGEDRLLEKIKYITVKQNLWLLIALCLVEMSAQRFVWARKEQKKYLAGLGSPCLIISQLELMKKSHMDVRGLFSEQSFGILSSGQIGDFGEEKQICLYTQ